MKTNKNTAMTADEISAICKRIVAANNRRRRLRIGWTEPLPIGEISAKIEIENRTSVLGGVFD